MTPHLPEGEYEVLWDDGEFILSRVKPRADSSTMLMLRPAVVEPSAASVDQLEHAHALQGELDASWASRSIKLIRDGGKLALFMEDPGGQLLARLIGKPWEVGPFLRVAIALACALSGLHRRGLVHKDLKPSNIIVEVAKGEAWLCSSSFITRLEREHDASSQAHVITRTLAYIAPEQTGRTNRSVDTRSNLYSLGVILYEMLTGTLPFSASEPLEWIHCHIARKPLAPSEQLHGIPVLLSAIILKLLAKNPEDRYQTARGVEADFRRCLSEWESVGNIEQFPLAAHDVPDRLLIPGRLYGRKREIALLYEDFERMARDGRQALVLVSGYSGAGKSSVVNELQKVIVGGCGIFASGKFEPHERDTPFAPIVRAFRDLVRLVLLSSDADLQRWREDIRRALGANAQLVVDLVPDIELIIGRQDPVADLPPQQAQARLYRTLQRFVGVFARSEHPLVLFLDDLQWLDRASLDLLGDLATHDERMHLLIVGSYRQNEVGPTHPLSATLSAIRSASVVHELEVAALDRENVRALICDTLHQGEDHTGPLAEVVYEKTAGNPFFVKQFLHELADDGCLTFDACAGAWVWDSARIQAKRYTDNVFDLLAGRLDRLSVATQVALRSLAFLSSGRADALSIVLECSEDALHAMFSEATHAGLVSWGEDGYAFCHDRIREAAYKLVPEHERAAVHLRIGRFLLEQMPAATVSERVFEVANQLNRGVALVTSPAERVQIAELNLIAGQRARTTSAYKSALVPLAAGEALLCEDDWGQHYRLRFSLAFYRAECEFLTGELLAAEERLARLRERTTGWTDLSAVACLRIAVYTTLDRTDRATEVGVEQLKAFGVDVPAHPSERDIREEYERLLRHLAERPLEADAWEAPKLLDPSSASDAELLATMEVLLAMLPAAVFTDKNLHDFAVIRLSNLSLEFGHWDGSILAYAHLSQTLGPRFGDNLGGFLFGNIALALAERREFTRSRAKVYTVVAYHVLPWTSTIQAASLLMRSAFELAQETGDLIFAAFSSCHLISLHLAAGDRLDDAELEAERYLASSRRAGFGLLVYCFLGQLHLVRSLRGQRETYFRQDEPAGLDEATVESRLEQDPRLAIAACWYWIRRLQARFHEGNYTSALEMGVKAERLLWTCPTFFEFAEYHFYSALAHAKVWDSAPEAEARGHHQALADHQAQLATWAANCVETFGSRAALAAAELARLENRILDAERLYEEAIRAASSVSAVNVEAIASEQAAHFYRARGLERIAQAYFTSACSCYRRWGAEAVARRLDAFSGFGSEISPLRATGTTTDSVESLDLATVIKASHSISSEILIDKLVETLMVTAVQHAGAERGLLIVRRDEESRVEAEATTQLEAIMVRLLGTIPEPSDLPIAVLNYVLRTKEAVILDDASVSNPFSADMYVVGRRVRSLLCLPLVKQTQLVGALYLENNVASHVFTPSRIELLKLLASQAAISLENARLYTDLRKAQAYLGEAQRLSATGSFGWKPSSGEIIWSEETHQMFALDRMTKPTVEFALSRTHPEDRESVQRLIDRATREAEDWDLEHRIVMPDGAVKHLHVVAHAVRDEATGEIEYVGAVMDVTNNKQAEERIRQNETELRQLINSLPQHVFVLDPDGRLVQANQMALEYTGRTLKEIQENGTDERLERDIHPDDLEKTRAEIHNGLSSGAAFDIERRALGKNRQYRWFLYRYKPILDEAGRVVRWFLTATDIEDRKQEEEELRKENIALRDEVLKNSMFEEIVGASPALQAVLARVAKVAPTDSTVLVTGETGTGKELIARAIHRGSDRASHAFVSVNCAAIPRDLVASELFGHEKGAFTGALQRRMGRFELAEAGTIFLDEVGELPAETQIALLRVLQEHEFERVGGTRSMQTNVRVIAATNRDLRKAIAAGAFRNDLFYRLNVFPIEVPPLRERKDDIPMLVAYFVDRFARKAGRRMKRVQKQTLELLQAYSWPGNIRELQNVLERSVILSDMENLTIEESWLSLEPSEAAPSSQPLAKVSPAQETEIIEKALAECRGRVSGPSGAAAKLGIPPSTLESRIRSLRINKYSFK